MTQVNDGSLARDGSSESHISNLVTAVCLRVRVRVRVRVRA